MAKLFDKVSGDFLNSIKSVMEKTLTSAEMKKREEVAKAIERDNPSMPMSKKMAIATATAKKVAEAKLDTVNAKELEGTHAQRKDKDINNDGKVDKSDEYLHARRKAVKHAIAKKMKEEVEQIDEISAAMKSRYKTAARRDLESAQDFKSELEHEGEPKSSRVSKQVSQIIKKRKTGLKRVGEEVEQIDEISTKLATDYSAKAADARGHRNLSTAKLDKRYKSMALAHEKIRARHAKVPTTEEVEQIDELSKKTLGSYTKKAAGSAAGVAAAAAGQAAITGKASDYDKRALRNRLKGISKATDKLAKEEADLTPEEIEMIESKMAGVADGALPGNEHMCATKVFHKEWKEGTPVPTMHADPDADGLIEWYDVMFDHGIERVMTEDMEIVSEMSHGHKKRGMKKEEVEQIDETAKVVAHLQKRYGDNIRKSHVRSAANDFGVGYVALAHAVRKKLGVNRLEEEQVDEARGRPKKESGKEYTVHPVTKEKMMHNNPQHMKRIENLYRIGTLKRPKTEADQNVITQLRKASTSMRGGETVHFSHGPSKHVGADVARKALDKHADMKPAEKEAFQKKISHSHEHLMKHI